MFCLRIGGTNEYVSKIDPTDSKCYPPGSVSLVTGIDHLNVLVFTTQQEAIKAGGVVLQIEGFTCSVEHVPTDEGWEAELDEMRALEGDEYDY